MSTLTGSLRVLAVAGARPNFMKIAALLRELEARQGFDVFLVHTGQHYDASMSDGFFADLGIREPDVNLGVGSGTHAVQTAAGAPSASSRSCSSRRRTWWRWWATSTRRSPRRWRR